MTYQTKTKLQSLDMEGSLSIAATTASTQAEGRRPHVRNAVIAMNTDSSKSDNRAGMTVTTNIDLKFDSVQVRKSGPLRSLEAYRTNRRVWTLVLSTTTVTRKMSQLIWQGRCIYCCEKSKRNRGPCEKRGRQFNYNDFDTQSTRVQWEEHISWFTKTEESVCRIMFTCDWDRGFDGPKKLLEVQFFWWYELKWIVPNVTISVILWVSRTNGIQSYWSIRGLDDTSVLSGNVEHDGSQMRSYHRPLPTWDEHLGKHIVDWETALRESSRRCSDWVVLPQQQLQKDWRVLYAWQANVHNQNGVRRPEVIWWWGGQQTCHIVSCVCVLQRCANDLSSACSDAKTRHTSLHDYAADSPRISRWIRN